MCGIAGYLDRVEAGPPHAAGVQAMMAGLAHRGPDASGFFADGPVMLGHRRLSIIDLRPEANQPLANEDGTIVVVANGEIYNFRELRADLEHRGHRFRSRSDCEVLAHAYEEHGVACLSQLRGMFAFALWDAPRRRLLLARDRAGEKPLYWAERDGCLWFASELRALWAALPWRPALDLDAIDQYLTLQYVPAPHTAWSGIHKLPAAHCLTMTAGGAPVVERWWRLSFGADPPPSFADAVQQTRALLEDAVATREVADVPLGAFLSGGIDSSTIVALLARRSSRTIKTFSVDMPAGDGGEARWARLVAQRYGTDHHELTMQSRMVDLLPELVGRYGEPFADPSALPTFQLAELARRHVTVALSGDGGDEAFGGYHRYALEELARQVGELPWPLPRLVHAIMRRLPGNALRPAREFAAHRWQSPVERYLFLLAHFSRRDKQRLLGPALAARAAHDEVAAALGRVLAASDAEDAVNRLLDLDTQTYLPDDIFTKVDIASMAHALEVRAPFVDHVLLERVARLPGSAKLRRFSGKHLLRHAVRDLVPAPILTRAKKGFNLPLDRWMRQELAEMTHDLLTDATARERGLFDAREVRRLLGEHAAGVSHGRRLWNLCVLELWLRQFVDQDRVAGRRCA
jgi:asparagine synthase (glutamine-hydrolysing)